MRNILILILFHFYLVIYSQKEINLNDNGYKKYKIEKLTIDEKKLINKKDTCDCAELYGFYRELDIDFIKNSVHDKIGTLNLYKLQIEADEAKSLELHFSKFVIPKFSFLKVQSTLDTTKSFILDNSFTKNDSTFYTLDLKYNSINFIYTIEDSILNKANIHLHSLVHVFTENNPKILLKEGYGEGLPCNIDVNCPEGFNYSNYSRSVILIKNLVKTNNKGEIKGRYKCSGVLLFNTKNEYIPYVLTAQHCIEGKIKNNLYNTSFYFNYQNFVCNDSIMVDALNPFNNYGIPYPYIITGAELIADRDGIMGNDFALLKLKEVIPNQYNAYYAGWSRNKPDKNEEAVCIHHPHGDAKKISFGNVTNFIKGYVYINWNNGSVEDGSSGAPLFNKNNLVVGQLAGTNKQPTCDNLGKDPFGLIKNNWNSTWGSSFRLKDWLDPDNLDYQEIEGSDPNRICSPYLYLSGPFPDSRYQPEPVEINSSNTIFFSNNNSSTRFLENGFYRINAGRTIRLQNEVRVEEGSDVRFKIQPCYNQANGSLKQLVQEIETVEDDSIIENILINSDKRNEDFLPEVKIYPNPSSDGQFTVNINASTLDYKIIEIYNCLGEKIMKLEGLENVFQVRLTDMKGIYLIKTRINDFEDSKKLIIN